ncbi:TPM domain-containing protein [Aurantiacibacter hainanensis]|uniref:TPM domain-containing protein n=1 Tax=Aurantiacibacter hainanensis TaxID=3076114 RepID=UPI0030C6B17B
MPILNEAQHKIVSDAVAEAEANTSGEIVPVLAERSDDYSDIALTWAAAVAFTAMSAFAFVPRPFLDLWDRLAGGWEHEWTTGETATMTIALGLIAFIAMWLVQLAPAIRFALVPRPVKQQRVRQRAIRHFKVGADGRTHGRTGVLLYLSMREHRAEIVADEPIHEKVEAEVWGEAMADMLDEIRKGCIAEGIAAGVRDVGQVLAPHFPRRDDDTNELPDRLIEL